jgi:hypothetical protein
MDVIDKTIRYATIIGCFLTVVVIVLVVLGLIIPSWVLLYLALTAGGCLTYGVIVPILLSRGL